MLDASLPNYDWLFSRTRAGRERGPQGARAVLDVLGAPDRQFKSIRVIGTNGKGSTCAMLEAGLIAAGVRVGRFTSPHLHHYEERIRVNGTEVTPERTAQFINWAREHAPNASFFDLTLAFGCQVFAEQQVEIAIMEAGVGGLSDATQALHNVIAVALTNAHLDHMGVLGNTIEEIATDKAGAALPGIPFLTTAQEEALEIAVQEAQKRDALLFTPDTHPGLFQLPHPPALTGPHQLKNAALALATLRTLGYEQGIDAALTATNPARLEHFKIQGKTVLIDGAHNPHATRALAEAVPHASVLLFGNLARKDTEATLTPLLNLADQYVFTAPGDLATPPATLAQTHGGLAIPNPLKALNAALNLTPSGGTLLVTGSLYLAGTAREILLQRLTSAGA